MDPSQWWDHRSQKVSEHQAVCQSSHVNRAISLVRVNLVCCSLLVAILPWSKLGRNFFSGPLQWWDSSSRLEKVGKCNMLMEKVSAAFSVLMIPFMPGFMPGLQRIHERSS